MKALIPAADWKGFREAVRVIWPLAIAQFVYAANHVWNRFWLAQKGGDELQASLSAAMAAVLFATFFAATVGYSATFVAQLHGEGRGRDAVKAFAQGLWLSLFVLPLLVLSTFAAFAVVELGGHAYGVMAEEKAYISIYVPGCAFMILNGVLGGLLSGQGRTRFISVCNMVGLGVNMALDPVFINVLKLGNAGAAIASVISMGTTALLLSFAVWRDPLFREFAPTGALRLDWKMMKVVLRYGVSNGLTSFVSCIGFTAFVLVLGGRPGVEASASNTVFAVNNVFYGFLCACSEGVCILTGRHHGARDTPGARAAVRACGRLVAAALVICFAVALTTVGFIMSLFYPTGAGYALADYQRVGTVLFSIMFFREIAEGSVLVLEGALRGVGDMRFVMGVKTCILMLLWFPSFVILDRCGCSIGALWMTMPASIGLIAAILFFRWRGTTWQSRRLM